MSAELRRNLWLEITRTRLITIPLLLALVFWGVGSIHGEVDYQALSRAALVMFTIVCALWGAHLTSSSITEEAQAQTWDWQRLSSQSPTELMAGKLFGSTVLAWYGGAWCLAAYLVFTVMAGQMPSVSWVSLSIGGAVFIQAGSMLMSLSASPDQRPVHQQRRGMGALRLLVIIIVLQSIAGLGTQLSKSNIAAKWYGADIALLPFVAISAIFWAAWAVFGCMQRLSTLLRCPTTPAPWLLFVAWCMFYFAGFTRWLTDAPNTKEAFRSPSYYGFSAYLVALALALILALHEDKSPVSWRMWLSAMHNRQYRLAWQRTPRWIATLVPVIFALCFAILEAAVSPWLLPAPLLLLVRDSAVLYSLYWASERTRPQLAFTIYLLLVYLLLPYLLSPFKLLFYPSLETPALSLLAFGVEAVLAAAVCIYRWKRFYTN
ncbi:MAG TPA: hypothetical protein VFQ97_02160 [Gallionella sp.]|nr:hypothetical protein [Gallionella sp.]